MPVPPRPGSADVRQIVGCASLARPLSLLAKGQHDVVTRHHVWDEPLTTPLIGPRIGHGLGGVEAAAVSLTHLVVIPSFNSGRLLAATVAAARAQWAPIWIVIDGSTDASAVAVEAMAREDSVEEIVKTGLLAKKKQTGNCQTRTTNAVYNRNMTQSLSLSLSLW